MREHYGNPYLSVSTSAFRRQYRGKGQILVLLFLLAQKVGNRTHRSERFLPCADPSVRFRSETGSCPRLRGRILADIDQEDKCTRQVYTEMCVQLYLKTNSSNAHVIIPWWLYVLVRTYGQIRIVLVQLYSPGAQLSAALVILAVIWDLLVISAKASADPVISELLVISADTGT
jgi:hypothetical protein